eukprot:136807-Pelagomonas_calceolata.AAC.1
MSEARVGIIVTSSLEQHHCEICIRAAKINELLFCSCSQDRTIRAQVNLLASAKLPSLKGTAVSHPCLSLPAGTSQLQPHILHAAAARECKASETACPLINSLPCQHSAFNPALHFYKCSAESGRM